ncbi:MAG: peptidase, partial [bacterium]|nr:peptidase [bacterium]
MKLKLIITCITMLVYLVLFPGTAAAADMEVGKTYHGFKLLEIKKIKEYNSIGKRFLHIKSGARLLKIENNEANNFFNIAFKTLPDNDKGTPHGLEHCVLQGSAKYPIKGMLYVLTKSSLATFQNGVTFPDFTTYPVASMNPNDFYNLMEIYMAQTFFPTFLEDENIFKQEVWHYELEKKEKDITINGVVYNEMKGAFSNPEQCLESQIRKELFPDVVYGSMAGGLPGAMPELSYEELKGFYKKYYHPSNSYIFLYGNGDLLKELQFIDNGYLSKFQKKTGEYSIALQKPFTKMKEARGTYHLSAKDKTENMTYLALSFVAGNAKQRELMIALKLLADILVNNQAAPLRRALIDAGIGKDVKAYVRTANQPELRLFITNANAADKDKFKKIVFDTLKKLVKNGIDKKLMEGIINKTEFRIREDTVAGSAYKTFEILISAMEGWLYSDDPFRQLEFEKPLAIVKTALTSDFMEKIIETHLLNNPHSLLTVLEPEPGLNEKKAAKEKEKLTAYKASLNEKERQLLVEQTAALKKYQNKTNSPDALKALPMVTIKDINPKKKGLGIKKENIENIAGVKTLFFPTFTNGITYLRLYFNFKAIPQESIQYAQLLAEFMVDLNTKNYTYKSITDEINIHTGGIYTYNSLTSDYKHEGGMEETYKVNYLMEGSVLSPKLDTMLKLMKEILLNSKYNDAPQLKRLLSRLNTRLRENAVSGGVWLAYSRLCSYYSDAEKFNELTGGLSYNQFVNDLATNFEKKRPEIISQLQKAASLLFNKNNLVLGVIASREDYQKFKTTIPKLLEVLPENTPKVHSYSFKRDIKNEGFVGPSNVQYVMKGYNYKKLGYRYSGTLRVANAVINDYLTNQVRILGGAYGAMAFVGKDGNLAFLSYRDPKLAETFKVFDTVPAFLKKFEADEETMKHYIIGAIAKLDTPKSPQLEGTTAQHYYFVNRSPQQQQQLRDEILATTAQDIRDIAKLIKKIMEQNVICAYGSEKKINENK